MMMMMMMMMKYHHSKFKMIPIKMILSMMMIFSNSIRSELHSFDWVLETKEMAPDNFLVTGATINGQFPGPEIKVVKGDKIQIKVLNKLSESVSIHWHGLPSINNDMDGLNYITQSPIQPNQEFTYHLETGNQMGTYYYYVSTGLLGEYLYGSLVILDSDAAVYLDYYEFYDYDDDQVLLLSGIWHEPQESRLMDLTLGPVNSKLTPDSFTINGHHYQDWKLESDDDYQSHNHHHNHSFNSGYYNLKLKPNRIHRLRVIGNQIQTQVSLKIESHPMTIIEVDGIYIQPIKVEYLIINPGQRISVLIQTDQPFGNYWMFLQPIGTNSIEAYGFGVLNYYHHANLLIPPNLNRINFKLPYPEPLTPWGFKEFMPSYSYFLPESQSHYYPPPPQVDNHIILNITDLTHLPHDPHYTINQQRTSPHLPLHQDRVVAPLLPNRFTGVHDQFIQIIFQLHSYRSCHPIPIHLHGHQFHIVAYSPDPFIPSTTTKEIDDFLSQLDSPLPPFTDTFLLRPIDPIDIYASSPDDLLTEAYEIIPDPQPPTSESPTLQFCGWTAIRFKARQGVWSLNGQNPSDRLRGLQAYLDIL